MKNDILINMTEEKTKTKIISIIAYLLLISISSCREASDTLMTYDHEDQMAFKKAETSFAAKFDVLWNGMNQNYSFWDYEAEHGVDWDAVYREYMPQFEALDKQDMVTDDELKALMDKVVLPLHDGHLRVSFSNHKTGTSEVQSIVPGMMSITSRDDYHAAASWLLYHNYYYDVANGEIMCNSNGQPIGDMFSTEMSEIFGSFFNDPDIGLHWINAKIDELKALSSPTETQISQFHQLESLLVILNQLKVIPLKNINRSYVDTFNRLAQKYASLQVPGLIYISPGFIDYGITLEYALFKGNIAYFRIKNFSLSPYLIGNQSPSYFGSSESTTRYINIVKAIWGNWLDIIQQLHKEGTLGGVIIDVRGNRGGFTADFDKVVGALLPSGGFQVGYYRVKKGTGRYDYAPLSAAFMRTMEQEHEVITEPVVILTNCFTTSMAEISTLAVKAMPNGTVVGKRTYGGLSPLYADNTHFSLSYMGYVGVSSKTPVYARFANCALFSLDKKILEGVGVEPDIDVDLDENLYMTAGRDSQLERALQYLRTGN